MKQQDITKYIGIPYKFLGINYEGVDCIGLCQLFLNEHDCPIIIRDGRPITKDWYLTEPFRLIRWLYANFDKVDDMNNLQYGDITLFEINGESHTGIYIGYGKVLTILEIYKKSMIIHLNTGNIFYQCGFRMR